MSRSKIKANYSIVNRKRILNVEGTGYDSNAIMSDILNHVGTLSTNILVEGTHSYNGMRYFTGFLYKEKSHGFLLVGEYTGKSRVIFLKEGVVTSTNLTT